MSQAPPRILIAADHASARFGGEAFLPLHYFMRLRRRGLEAWLVSHARVRDELLGLLPDERDRMHFVEDTAFDRLLWKISRRLPPQAATVSTQAIMQLETQIRQRRLVRRLVKQLGVDVVHQPIPVSPKLPSVLWHVGAPVIIGPMNGGMTFPPGFSGRQGRSERLALIAARAASNAANLVLRGKRQAALLLVANQRTRRALPSVVGKVPVEELVENGVDLDRFQPRGQASPGPVFRAAFVGRLVDWKAVDLLIDALHSVRADRAISLDIFGDGDMRESLEGRVDELGLGDAVHFHGFVPQEEVSKRLADIDALVLPSLYECGGAVVLEAMAIGLPVIATRWGGPADYLDDDSGLLIEPESRDQMVSDIAAALGRLATDAELCERLGSAARAKALTYDWERKMDTIIGIYSRVITGAD